MTVKLREFHAIVGQRERTDAASHAPCRVHEEVSYMSPGLTTDVLVVAAHPPELAGLKAILGDALRGQVNGIRIAADAVGIGLAAAAATSVA
jgi:hypothetical protein